ncbi:MAG: MaoC family dehydratase N-terminal domain-containing protein [Acidimicrobiales bacterium]|nr:MaoC family dehydratase N-terminal domain-containing protein [Acidimicrobiales bacterium]
MEKDDVVGRPTGTAKVVVERGPVMKFAEAVHNDSRVYQDADAARAVGFSDIPVPPTYGFSALQYWGKFPEQQPSDPTGGKSPLMEIIGGLMAKGGIVLHGEQEFIYHRPIVVGDELTSEGRVVDYYTKESSSGKTMTFVVTEDVYRDAEGNPVLTSRMNLIHRG